MSVLKTCLKLVSKASEQLVDFHWILLSKLKAGVTCHPAIVGLYSHYRSVYQYVLKLFRVQFHKHSSSLEENLHFFTQMMYGCTAPHDMTGTSHVVRCTATGNHPRNDHEE